MKTINIVRQFQFNSNGKQVTLTDPNPNFTEQEVCDFFAAQYPELTNAVCINLGLVDDKMVFEFKTILGTKG